MNIEHRTSNIERRMSQRATLFDVQRSMFSVRCFLILIIRLYRLTLSPAQIFVFGPSAGCRFTPSCSQYAIEALQTHGAIRGSWLATKRVCRCHPWGECGHDPVPAVAGILPAVEPGISPGGIVSRTRTESNRQSLGRLLRAAGRAPSTAARMPAATH